MVPYCRVAWFRTRKIASEWERFRLEIGVWEKSCGLAAGARGVVCEMCNRTSVLDGASDLSDLGHVDRRVPPFQV
jgi:hypothetical protein